MKTKRLLFIISAIGFLSVLFTSCEQDNMSIGGGAGVDELNPPRNSNSSFINTTQSGNAGIGGSAGELDPPRNSNSPSINTTQSDDIGVEYNLPNN